MKKGDTVKCCLKNSVTVIGKVQNIGHYKFWIKPQRINGKFVNKDIANTTICLENKSIQGVLS